MSLHLFAKFPTENVDFISWLTQKNHFFGAELSNLGGYKLNVKPKVLLHPKQFTIFGRRIIDLAQNFVSVKSLSYAALAAFSNNMVPSKSFGDR